VARDFRAADHPGQKMAKAKKEEAEAKEPAEGGAEGEAAAVKKKFGLKKIIILVAGLAVLGGGGFGGYKFFFGHKGHDEKPVVVVKPPAFYDLPEVLVNLSSAGNDRTQYLRAKIVLEVADQATVDQIKPVLPRVLDAFQTYLREMRSTDLEGSAGLYRLRDELTRRVNIAIAPSRINAVLFKEIIVQ
jgi:flagellar FliL protein